MGTRRSLGRVVRLGARIRTGCQRCRLSRGAGARQRDDERAGLAAARERRSVRRVAAVGARELADDVEAETGAAAGLPGGEPLEEARRASPPVRRRRRR